MTFQLHNWKPISCENRNKFKVVFLPHTCWLWDIATLRIAKDCCAFSFFALHAMHTLLSASWSMLLAFSCEFLLFPLRGTRYTKNSASRAQTALLCRVSNDIVGSALQKGVSWCRFCSTGLNLHLGDSKVFQFYGHTASRSVGWRVYIWSFYSLLL